MGFDPSVGSVSAASSQVQFEATQQALAQGATDTTEIRFSNIGEFQKKYPEIYNAFMLASAYAMRGEMQRSNDRLIETLKESRREQEAY